MPTTIGPRGLALIKKYEGLLLRAYLPTSHDVWTIGYGHTAGVERGDVITEQQADELLASDVKIYEKVVLDRLSGVDLTQSMFDALVSLCYNVGPQGVSSTSTIARALRAKDYVRAANGFTLWDKQRQNGRLVILRGLTARRQEEKKLFLADGEP